MSDVIDLQQRRAPVHYTVRLTHHWDGSVDVFVEDLADTMVERQKVADTMAKAAEAFGVLSLVEEMREGCALLIEDAASTPIRPAIPASVRKDLATYIRSLMPEEAREYYARSAISTQPHGLSRADGQSGDDR